MPSKTMTMIPEFSPPYSIEHGGMTDEEAGDMALLVLRHVKAVMKDRGDFNDPRNWSAVADDIADEQGRSDRQRGDEQDQQPTATEGFGPPEQHRRHEDGGQDEDGG